MKLTDLEPQFLRISEPDVYDHTDDIAEADGVMFECPKCRGHQVLCWQPHVPQSVPPTPGRWRFEGTGLDDLSLVAGSSSVHLSGPGCGAHFFVRNGSIA